MFGRLNPATGALRAVSPVLDAPGDRGGVHHRRARQLHDLPHVLEDREGRARTIRSTTPKKARRAIARFVSLHPHHLAQKAEIIVEHFRAHTAKEMQGLAKAMVVTSSRLHAVRYKQAIDRYIAEHGYDDIRTLVAFSGKLDDGTGIPLTEQGMNGFPESQTAERFAGTGVRGADRGREVPDRLRSAAAADDVRRQDARRAGGGADAVAAEPDPPAQGTTPSCSTSATRPTRSSRRSSSSTASPSRRRPTRTSSTTRARSSSTTTCCARTRSPRRCRRCSIRPAARSSARRRLTRRSARRDSGSRG